MFPLYERVYEYTLNTYKIHKIIISRLYEQNKFGNRSHGFSAQAAWNSLPKDLHDSSIFLLSFKSMLKTHWFGSY